MSALTEDELLGNEVSDDENRVLTKEDEDFLLQDEEEDEDGDQYDVNIEDNAENDDVLELDLEFDEAGFEDDQEDEQSYRTSKFTLEKQAPDPAFTTTESKIYNKPQSNKVNTTPVPSTNNKPPVRNINNKTRPKLNSNNRGNRNEPGNGRRKFFQRNNRNINNDPKNVFVNPNFQGVVELQDNNIRLAHDKGFGVSRNTSNVQLWNTPQYGSNDRFYDSPPPSNFQRDQQLRFEPPPPLNNFFEPPPRSYHQNQHFPPWEMPYPLYKGPPMFENFSQTQPPPLMRPPNNYQHQNETRQDYGSFDNFNNFNHQNVPPATKQNISDRLGKRSAMYNDNEHVPKNKNRGGNFGQRHNPNLNLSKNVNTNSSAQVEKLPVAKSQITMLPEKRKSVENVEELVDRRPKVEKITEVENNQSAIVDGESKEDREYRLKIEEQKRERERIIKLKEERRQMALLKEKEEEEEKTRKQEQENLQMPEQQLLLQPVANVKPPYAHFEPQPVQMSARGNNIEVPRVWSTTFLKPKPKNFNNRRPQNQPRVTLQQNFQNYTTNPSNQNFTNSSNLQHAVQNHQFDRSNQQNFNNASRGPFVENVSSFPSITSSNLQIHDSQNRNMNYNNYTGAPFAAAKPDDNLSLSNFTFQVKNDRVKASAAKAVGSTQGGNFMSQRTVVMKSTHVTGPGRKVPVFDKSPRNFDNSPRYFNNNLRTVGTSVEAPGEGVGQGSSFFSGRKFVAKD